MSPVLLDHRNLKWIWLSVGLLVAMTYLGGYIMGFEKSNNKWLARLDPTEITLPNALVSDLIAVEPQTPEIEEPGASIDVDSVDESTIEKVVAIAPEIEVPVAGVVIEEKPAKPVPENKNNNDSAEQKMQALESNKKDSGTQASITEELVPTVEPVELATMTEASDMVSGMGGPAQDEQDAGPLSEPSSVATVIVDDAIEETARYSIQVGMYKSFDNAAAKVEKLINSNLSGYVQEYQNKKDETRYNVRFGYFGSFSSVQQALAIYEQNFSGSGYIARIKR